MTLKNSLSLGLVLAGLEVGCGASSAQTAASPSSSITSPQAQISASVSASLAPSASASVVVPPKPAKVRDEDFAENIQVSMMLKNSKQKCPAGNHLGAKLLEKKGEAVKYKIACLDDSQGKVTDLVEACKGEVFIILKDWPADAAAHPATFQAWYCEAK